MTSLISKIPTTQTLAEGGGVNSKPHLYQDWSTSLWNTYAKKVGKFFLDDKKIDPSESQS